MKNVPIGLNWFALGLVIASIFCTLAIIPNLVSGYSKPNYVNQKIEDVRTIEETRELARKIGERFNESLNVVGNVFRIHLIADVILICIFALNLIRMYQWRKDGESISRN